MKAQVLSLSDRYPEVYKQQADGGPKNEDDQN